MQSIGEDIWQVPGTPLRMPGGMILPIAATVIRLRTGGLVVYSPVQPEPAAGAAIDALGPVEHVIAPSALHHLYAAAAAARWPAARIHAAAGARAKQPALRVDRDLAGGPDPAWQGTLDVVRIAGAPQIDEHVAFHRPSGTLICADLLFHITRPANLATRIILTLMGTGGGRLAQSRVWRFARRDRAAARASLARVLAWPIRQVAPCHGEPCAVTAAELAPRLARLAGGRAAALALGPGPVARASDADR